MDGAGEARAINVQIRAYVSRAVEDYPRDPATLDLHVEIVSLEHFDARQVTLQKLRNPVRVDVESGCSLRGHVLGFDAGRVGRVHGLVVLRVASPVPQDHLLIVMGHRVGCGQVRGTELLSETDVGKRVPVVLAHLVPIPVEDPALHRRVAGLVEISKIDTRRLQQLDEVRLRRFSNSDRGAFPRTDEPGLQERAIGIESERCEPCRGTGSDYDNRVYCLSH